MAEQNADVPQAPRIEFRIGINVGDIIIDGDDIFGDGVNIAARLEEHCRTGRRLHVEMMRYRGGPGQDRYRLRRSWRADAEEY